MPYKVDTTSIFRRKCNHISAETPLLSVDLLFSGFVFQAQMRHISIFNIISSRCKKISIFAPKVNNIVKHTDMCQLRLQCFTPQRFAKPKLVIRPLNIIL